MVGFSKSEKDPPLKVKMVSAGLAGIISDLITFPLDTAKVRLQVQGEGVNTVSSGGMLKIRHEGHKYRGMINTIATISREEGPRSLYNGLVPGLQRQMAFCAVRIGAYDAIRDFYLRLFHHEQDDRPHVTLRILAGATTGCLAVLVAQPTDVVKIRMQADMSSRGARRYTGSISAYRNIGKHEGIKGLWKGTSANIARMTVVNAAELVSYDLIKQTILKYKLLSDNLPCHFVSAFGAGFCTTVIASPVDVVKTRFMNSPKDAYKGVFDCAATMFKENGPLAFYKGFMPNFMRLASWNICMFVAFEQLKRAFMQIPAFSGDPSPEVDMRSAKLIPVSAKIIQDSTAGREGSPT